MSDFRLPEPVELRCEWLWIYDGRVPTTDIWSKEILVPASVFFVVSGHGQIQAEGEEQELPRGTAFLAAPGLRRQRFATGTRLLSVAFRATWLDGMPLFSAGLNRSLVASKLRPLHAATRALYHAQHGTRRSVTYHEAVSTNVTDWTAWSQREAAFRTWFAVYVKTVAKLDIHPAPRQRPSDERISEIIRRLEAWPLARPLSLNELAHGLNIGGRRLEQLLAADMGLTPHAYLNRRRIDTARHLLAGTTVPLKQIAHELGLRHPSHFTKWFRQHAGMAPSAYREGGSGEAV